jgi:hypothetical protein
MSADEDFKRFKIEGRSAKGFIEDIFAFRALHLELVITNKVENVSGFEIQDTQNKEVVARGEITYDGRNVKVPRRVDITIFAGKTNGDLIEKSVHIYEGKPFPQPLAVR